VADVLYKEEVERWRVSRWRCCRLEIYVYFRNGEMDGGSKEADFGMEGWRLKGRRLNKGYVRGGRWGKPMTAGRINFSKLRKNSYTAYLIDWSNYYFCSYFLFSRTVNLRLKK
jgi:hypothetical protein